MKNLYIAPKSERVQLDPLMVTFGTAASVSIAKDQVISGPGAQVD